jgi:hypothetical protein
MKTRGISTGSCKVRDYHVMAEVELDRVKIMHQNHFCGSGCMAKPFTHPTKLQISDLTLWCLAKDVYIFLLGGDVFVNIEASVMNSSISRSVRSVLGLNFLEALIGARCGVSVCTYLCAFEFIPCFVKKKA